MKRSFILFFIFMNFHNIYCQDEVNLCKGCFESVGIKDFKLGSTKGEVGVPLIPINDEMQFIDSYCLVGIIHLNQKDYEITYYLNYKDGVLKDYHFKIKGNRELFYWIIKRMEIEDKSMFSGFENTKNKYSFFSKNKYCKRSILLSRLTHNNEYIKGQVKR